jgi:prolyl-tRNA synthetase
MEKLADIKNNFPQWYQDIVYKAELADQSPSPGFFVIRPYGYALWENIKQVLDKKIKDTGTQNAYFPILIPESFLKKEEKHVEGFAPELAVVTHAGGKKLEEPLVVRPTSETIIYDMFSKWIKSWRDLPFKINQWANVVRWEMRPRAFLRSREFLWQEGHTAHRNLPEATQMAKEILDLYKNFIEEHLAIPVIAGEKSETERFAGASNTFTMEALMQDGKALQMGTTHILLQSFSKAFNILFQDKDNSMQSPYCTSWGLSTRLIGALIMVHGDQNGLVMPPRIAPIQVVIIPIVPSKKTEQAETLKNVVADKVNKLKDWLTQKNIRVHVDNDPHKSPGAKFFHWEMRGVPIRVEIGPKDLEAGVVAIAKRLKYDNEKKKDFVDFGSAPEVIEGLLLQIQKDMFKRAGENLHNQWYQADKLENFGPKLEKDNGIYQSGWCGRKECEDKLKPCKGTIRCLVEGKVHSTCFACEKESKHEVLIAKAY